MSINSISAVKARGTTKARFNDQLVDCALDTSVQRSMFASVLIPATAVEPFDNDTAWRGQPVAAAIGQYHAVFNIDQEPVTTPLDVVPGAEGITLGTDWLNDNVREWNLDTGIIIIIIIKKVKILGSMEQLAAAHCPTERTLDPQYAAQQTHLCSSQLYYGFHPTMFSGSDFAIFMLSRWLWVKLIIIYQPYPSSAGSDCHSHYSGNVMSTNVC